MTYTMKYFKKTIYTPNIFFKTGRRVKELFYLVGIKPTSDEDDVENVPQTIVSKNFDEPQNILLIDISSIQN